MRFFDGIFVQAINDRISSLLHCFVIIKKLFCCRCKLPICCWHTGDVTHFQSLG